MATTTGALRRLLPKAMAASRSPFRSLASRARSLSFRAIPGAGPKAVGLSPARTKTASGDLSKRGRTLSLARSSRVPLPSLAAMLAEASTTRTSGPGARGGVLEGEDHEGRPQEEEEKP